MRCINKISPLYLVVIVLIFPACGVDQQVVDQMADEMCVALEKYDPNYPLKIEETVTMLNKIKMKEENKKVTVSQLETSMFKKCRAGLNKFKMLTEQSIYSK
jgi:hypothetical protein